MVADCNVYLPSVRASSETYVRGKFCSEKCKLGIIPRSISNFTSIVWPSFSMHRRKGGFSKPCSSRGGNVGIRLTASIP